MTTELGGEVTVGLMRHRPDCASRYAMEYLFVRLIQYFREQGYSSFSLGMVPLAGFHTHPLAPRWHRLGRLIWSLGRRFYNFQGLRDYKDKFDPVWESKFLASPGGLRLPMILTNVATLISGGAKGLVGK